MGSLLQDLRYGIRNLRRSAALTTVAVITLALGIGANTAIFSMVDAILLRPLPFHDSGQLVRLYETESAPGHFPFAGPDYVDWKAQNTTLEGMALFGYTHDYNLSGSEGAAHVIGTPTEANFFSLLGARPLLGRTWAQGEDQRGHSHVAILSYGLWQGQFAGDANNLKRTVELNNEAYTIVGVMPSSFHYPLEAQLWIPQEMDTEQMHKRGTHWVTAIGRLKPGVTVQQAQAELATIAARLEQQYPGSNHKVGAFVEPLQEDLVGDSRDSLLLMLGAVGLILLIACANVANLLLSRAVARQKEMAVRSALGAARARLIRQLLTESLLLAITGGILGLAVARGGIRLLTALKHLGVPNINAIEINLPVLGFTLAIAALAGILFGIFPALHTSRPDLFDELRGTAGSSATHSRSRRLTSNALVVTEVALSVLLLISAGLLLKDFIRLRATKIGVRPENVLTAQINLPESKYSEHSRQMAFTKGILEKVRHLPGVESAAISDRLPLEGGSNGTRAPRGKNARQWEHLLVENHNVSPGYFHAMGIPLIAGRDLTDADVQRTLQLDVAWHEMHKQNLPDDQRQALVDGAVYPVVINQRLAHEFWPNQDAIGQFYSGDGEHGPWYQVVGVVGDVKQGGLAQRRAAPENYPAYDGDSSLFLVLHTTVAPESVVSGVRHELAQMDSSLPLFEVRTMDEVIAQHAAGQQVMSGLLGIFAALALALAAVGIYGVLSYSVTQRTHEIGIRMSLGARRSDVLRLVMGHGTRLVIVGFVLGLAGAFAARRLMKSLLHAIQAGDPAVYVAAPLVLGAIALLACYSPARRAARVDPMCALRYE